LKEADAKKKKIPIPAALGLKVGDAKQLTLELVKDIVPETPEKIPTKIGGVAKPTPVQKSTAGSVRDSKAGGLQKEAAKGPEIDKDADFATDPIAACFNERLKAGNAQESIKEADAKKKKIPIPATLGLKIADAKQLTLEFVKEESIEPEKILKKAISERMT